MPNQLMKAVEKKCTLRASRFQDTPGLEKHSLVFLGKV
jgi:hypothetical protein